MPARTTFAAWSQLMRGLAEPVLAGTPLVDGGDAGGFVRGFVDEMGHRRAVDRWLLAWMLGVDAEDAAIAEGPRTLSLRLWRGLVRGDAAALEQALSRGAGSVTERDDGLAIEVWTEDELSALHAMAHYAAARSGTPLGEAAARRVREAAAWHTATLQPDNGTNHPWAAHVFAARYVETGDTEALVHAETLVNICCVGRGRPDRFSACLLLDGARWLASAAGGG